MSEPITDIHLHNGEVNPTVRRERTDVNTRSVLWFVGALGAGIVIAMIALFAMFNVFHRAEVERKRTTFPLAVEPGTTLPQSPRLEGISVGRPEHSVGRNKAGAAIIQVQQEEAVLRSYGWQDAGKTVARIPIEEAMRRAIALLPARKDAAPPAEFYQEPSDSSAGRAPRGSTK